MNGINVPFKRQSLSRTNDYPHCRVPLTADCSDDFAIYHAKMWNLNIYGANTFCYFK